MHKPSRAKLIFEGYEIDDDGDTWYLLRDENGDVSRICEDEIEYYSLYPTSPVWKMNPPGEYKMNPSAYAERYVKDHILMTPKEEKFERFKLKGPIGSAEFFEQIAKKVQVFGEGQGWVRDGYLYWKKGPGHLNYVEVDGHMLEGSGTAWMHTHPAAWEPSQSSPDDFKVMHGLFINHGVRDFFTIIADRIDWFRVKKKDQIPLEEMVEVIEEFEEDIEKRVPHCRRSVPRKMETAMPTLNKLATSQNTSTRRYQEFQMSYRAYALSPQQMNGRSVPNPPPTVPVHGFFRGN